MGAERDLKSAQAGVSRSQALISQAEAQIAQAKASGRSTSSGERLLAAAKQNLAVFQSRASTAFAEVAREAAQKAAAKAKAQAEAQRKAEIARAKAEAKARAEAEARSRQQALEATKKAEAERAAKEQAQILAVQKSEPPVSVPDQTPLPEKLGELVETKKERLEASGAEERLSQDLTPFEQGMGFEREDQVIDPKSAEGKVISGQVKEQDIFSRIGDVQQTQKFVDVTLAPTGQEALQISKERKTVEPDFTTGSTILVPAEEAGVPGLSGDLVADLPRFSELGEDRFEAAAAEFEFRGEPEVPTGFGPKKQQAAVSKQNDPLSVISSLGLKPTSQKIQTGFIPFDPPKQSSSPFQGSLTSLFGESPSKTGKSASVFGSAQVVKGSGTVKPVVQGFESFLGGLGKDLGLDVQSDFFKTISKGVSFDNIFGGLVPGVQQKKPTLSSAQKAKNEISSLKNTGRSVPVSLIAQAFPEKSKQAKQLGFQLNSSGEFVEGFASKGTLTGVKTKDAKKLLEERKIAAAKAAAEAKRKAEIKRKVAAQEAAKRAKAASKKKAKAKATTKKPSKPKAQQKAKAKATTKKPTKRTTSSFTPSTRRIKNPFERFGLGDRSGFF